MVSLDDFLGAIFVGYNPATEVVCLADQRPDPTAQRMIFPARPWRPGRSRVQGQTYFSISTVKPPEPGAKLQRTLSHVVRTYVVVLDDIGTKILLEKFKGKAAPHYILETSPGNFQWGYRIEASDPDRAAALIHALALAGYTDVGAQGKNRVVRVPGSINTKHGQKFVATLHEWHPDDPPWTIEELAAEFGVTPVSEGAGSSIDRPNYVGENTNDLVFQWLHDHDMVLGPANQDGYASIVCPWSGEHTDPRQDARWAIGSGLTGAFKCFHAACQDRHTHHLLDWIEQTDPSADFGNQSARQASAVGVKLLRRIGKEPGYSRGRDRGSAKPAPGAPQEPQESRRAAPAPVEPPDVSALLAAILDDMPWLQRSDLPTVERTAGGGVKAEQKPTAENVGWVATGAGFFVRRNEMTGEVEIEHDDRRLNVFTAPQERQRIIRELLISVCQRVGISARGSLSDLLSALVSGNGYHPLVEWARSKPWDGIDRISELASTLKARDPEWCAISLRRWLVQGAAAWTNWLRQPPLAVPYVFVLCGPQGCGKTSWFRSLLPDGMVQTEAALHLDSMRADDQKRKVLSSPIVELGELETTFGRSEIGALKSFLSNTTDRYRLPYDRDVTIRIRSTIFGASVNDPEFLLDPTGARRFWVNEVMSCDWNHGIDLQQLWAQAFRLLDEGIAWNLVEDREVTMHRVTAERHRVISYAENLLAELLLRKETITAEEWTHASAAEVARYYKLESNANNWRAVGRKLRELFGDPSSSNGKRGWRVPVRKHEFTSGYIPYHAPGKGLRVVK